MIKKLVLKGFQNHKQSVFKFHPGLNVITGESDIGKTSIFRAIYWTLFNKPKRNSYLNFDSKNLYVSLTFDNGIIKRIKTKTKNAYQIISKKLGIKKTYQSFKFEMPPEISEVSSMSDVHFQGQFDSPFMLSESGGYFLKKLNEYVSLEKMDTSQEYINKKIRETKTEINYLQKQKEIKEEKIKKLEKLDEIKKAFDLVTKKAEEIKREKKNKVKIQILLASIKSISNKLKYSKLINKFEEELLFINNKHDILSKKKKIVTKALIIINEIKEINRDIKFQIREKENCESFLKAQIGRVCPLCKNKIKTL